MMNKLMFSLVAASLLLAGCAKEVQVEERSEERPSVETTQVRFSTVLPGMEVKTALGDESGHKSVSWAEGDMVRVFYADTYTDVEVTVSDGSVDAGVMASDYYAAVYPALPGTMNGHQLAMTIPAQQDGNFASANVMAAFTSASDPTFQFRNAAGVLSFEVTRDDLTKVVIRSNDASALAGTQTLTFTDGGVISEVSYSDGSPEITVPLSGKGTYYVAVMMNVQLKAGLGMRFFKGEEALSGVLSSTAVIMSPSILLNVGTPDSHINSGDFYIKSGSSGSGTSWDDAGGESLLQSLLGGNATMDGVTTSWRLSGKTIHIGEGTYAVNGTIKGMEGFAFGVEGTGSPVLTSTSGRILSLEGIMDAQITGISFKDAVSAQAGGALYCDVTGELSFASCDFTGNKSALGGGAMAIVNGDVSFSSCTFRKNVAGNGVDTWELSRSGGALSVEGASITVQQCVFDSNRAHSSADIHISNGATVYVNRSAFFGGSIIQDKNYTYYYAKSITVEEGSAKLPSCLGVNNSTFTGHTSVYPNAGGCPTVSVLSSTAAIVNTTIINPGINLILCRKKVENDAALYAFNNLLLNEDATVASINLNAPYVKNAYFNVVCVTKNNWKLDESDIWFSINDFTLNEWDSAKGYYTWTLNEGLYWPTALAEKATLAQKTADAMPEFNAWLGSVETNPYDIDQSGAARTESRMTPGAWESPDMPTPTEVLSLPGYDTGAYTWQD